MASHDKKGMIDRKEDETTEKESTLVADVSTTPLPKKLSITQFTGLSVCISNTVCQSDMTCGSCESWKVSHRSHDWGKKGENED